MDRPETHVLLIEDNPGDADLVRLRLVESQPQVRVDCVPRLSDALESLGKETPSLVLLDLNLPDSRGAETFRKIMEKAPNVPVVILSGQDDEALAVKAVHLGVQDYLVKGDISSKQLERAMRYAVERQALLRSLEIASKQQLEFKNQFLSHVSHELRTPLTCIHQYVTLLVDGLAGPVAPEQSDHLRTVLKSVNQLHAMIRDLLEATRAESGTLRVEPRCVSIGELMQQAVAMMRPTAQGRQIGLEIGLDSRIPLVYADPDRIHAGRRFSDGAGVHDRSRCELSLCLGHRYRARHRPGGPVLNIRAAVSGPGFGRQQSLRPGFGLVHLQRIDPAAWRADLGDKRAWRRQHSHFHAATLLARQAAGARRCV